MTDYRDLTRIRLENPAAIVAGWQNRRKHPGVGGKQNFIVAADHPARGALSVAGSSAAMADRGELLARLQVALAHPEVDGVLGTPDILDDLLLLGALDGKLIFGSMNRGGLSGLVNEIDDRFTAYTATALKKIGADGGKMLSRICYQDPDTAGALEACAHAVDTLAAQQLIAMIEPFISVRTGHTETGVGKVTNDLSPDAVIKSMAIASGLGATSAYSWLKVPVVTEMERVVAATTLPIVLLGGDPDGDQDETFANWQKALALPGVQGLTVGRSLLYPADGDVAAAVATAASLLNQKEVE